MVVVAEESMEGPPQNLGTTSHGFVLMLLDGCVVVA